MTRNNIGLREPREAFVESEDEQEQRDNLFTASGDHVAERTKPLYNRRLAKGELAEPWKTLVICKA